MSEQRKEVSRRDEVYDIVGIRDGSTPLVGKVLVKFFFTSPKHVPRGISKAERPEDGVIDALHAQAVKFQDPALGEVGRHRADRVDTGECMINNAPSVHAGILRKGLLNNGFALTRLCWYQIPMKPGSPSWAKPKCVVQAEYRPVSPDTLTLIDELSPVTLNALRALARTHWGALHVWKNPDLSVTINFVKYEGDTKPQRALVIRDGAIQLNLVGDFTPEDQEREGSMHAAFDLFRNHGADNPHFNEIVEAAKGIDRSLEPHE